MMNSLAELRRHSAIVADTAEYLQLPRLQPQDATTNPSLVLRAVRQPEYAALLALPNVRHAARTDPDAAMDHLLVAFGCEILQRIPGRVSTEVDSRLSHDAPATLARARRLIALYAAQGVGRERVLIKIAATWDGIEAARQLANEGIACNMTLLFAFAQARACAAAGVQLISPFVGRITDWYRQQAGAAWDAASMRGPNDPGVQALVRIWRFYKARGIATEVMGASFRDIAQIAAVSGCDLLTIAPALLDALAQSDQAMSQQLDPRQIGAVAHARSSATDAALERDLERDDDAPLALTRAQFDVAHDRDAMCRAKLAEGIASFSADTVALLGLLQG
jgi:transaldolase